MSLPCVEFKEKVKKCITDLQREKDALEQRIKRYEIISEKEFHKITSQIDCIFRKNLRGLFGKDQEWWFRDEFLDFRSPEKGKASEELVFAFWGCDGSESYRKEGEPTPFLRENVYLRGIRWEDKEKRTQFYKNFRKIKFLFRNYVPVDFFGCLAKKCPPILRIATNNTIQQPNGIPTIALPLGETFVKKFSQETSSRTLAEQICKCSQNKQKEIDAEKIEKLWDEIRNNKELEKSNFIKELCKQFEDAGVKISEKENNYKNNEIVFMIATSFQYYSWSFKRWPYYLYIISPSIRKRREISTCFSLAIKEGNNKISQYLKSLQDLIVNGFSDYRKIEVKVWRRLSQDIHYYWMWKKEYENRKEKFEALCNAIKFIVQGICEKREIKYKDITHRVKEFDKFYDKIVEKINNPSEELETLPSGLDFPKKLKDKICYNSNRKLLIFKGVMSEEEKNSLLNLSEDNKYRKAIEELFNSSTKLYDVFRSPQLSFDELIKRKFVKDIAGIRVICYYKSDAKNLWDLIKKDCEKNEGSKEYHFVHFDKPKEPSDKPGRFEYPRFHLWIQLQDKRSELPEYFGLKDIPCEIQVGTILEEGWADVNHEITYKPESFLPDDNDDNIDLKHISFSDLLPCIKQTDKGFDKLREDRKNKDLKYGGAS